MDSFARGNTNCRLAADTARHHETKASVLSAQEARELITSVALHTHIRSLYWGKESSCDDDEDNDGNDDDSNGFSDIYEETELLLRLLRKSENLERLIIFSTVSERIRTTLDQIHLPRLKYLETSKFILPQSLLPSFPNLETIICRHELDARDAELLVSRLGSTVKSLALNARYISDPLLQIVARVTSLEELRIETPPPHDIPYNPISYKKLGIRWANILKPLQKLRILSLHAALGRQISLEEREFERELDNIIHQHLVSWPIAKALPSLEEISWMFVVGDSSNVRGLSWQEREEENSWFYDSEELTVKVIRQDGKVIVEFENGVEEDVVEEIKKLYPEVHDLSSFKNIIEY